MNEPIQSERVEAWFVIPLVRESNKKQPHNALLWGCLRAELYRAAGGETRKRIFLEDVERSKGSWNNPETGKAVQDTSRKYTVIIDRHRADTVLREVLERAANSFDQDEILFLVQGVERSVKRDRTKGFLDGDPEGA
jgi:hypothetical protein